MTRQEVNLLEAGMLPQKQLIERSHLLWANALVLVVLLCYSGWESLAIADLQTEREAKLDAQQKMQAVAESAKLGPMQMQALVSEIDSLKQRQTQRQQLASSLTALDDVQFSQYLRGLAAANVKGLWLQDIDLARQPDGLRIGLAGQTVHPQTLPEWLAALAQQPVFQGHQFADVEIAKAEPWHEFRVATTGESS